ncbi:MAG: haloacid dehalogenase-like hydrolase [Phycisphaerae bacterium]|nr:haloacid dehalogenase-like hydrolase [Phycisphaerae bacterium]
MVNMNEIKCVIFDFAFTLCSDFFFKVTPPECPDWFYQFQRKIFCRHSRYTDDWMAGKLTSGDIAEIMTQHIPLPAEKILEVMAEGCRNLEFNRNVFRFAQEQRQAGRKTALVTANMDVFTSVVVPCHGLDEVFDVILNTADYGEIRKDRLWLRAFEQLGDDIGYHNSLLIEDGTESPTKFRELGGMAYQYTTDNAFAEWLKNGNEADDIG